MIVLGVEDRELLSRVSEQLIKTPTSTDHLMLRKWRVFSLCQYLLGGSELELETACRSALEAFLSHVPGSECDKALEAASAVISHVEGSRDPRETVLPSLSKEKLVAVSMHLDSLMEEKAVTIERALQILPPVRERIYKMTEALLLPGIRHRFNLIMTVLVDSDREESFRIRAAAVVLYINEVNDVIHDNLSVIGLIYDDYALRLVLKEINGNKTDLYLHWSEKIISLWIELPFLNGVKLQRDDNPISVTWLDRVNSFVSYSHVLGTDQNILVLLQPSIACSPLHMIISLIGLLVLDAVTSSIRQSYNLHLGQIYEIDGTFVQFEGFEDQYSTRKGWLRLLVRGCIEIQKPDVATRMVPVEKHRLSSIREYSIHAQTMQSDPLKRFFDWDHAIEPASLTTLLVIVASRQRAIEVLKGVQSNGVHLLEHGLVRFISTVSGKVDTYGSLVFVVPSLSTVRILLDQGIQIQAVLIDGYDHLNNGRHDLPFLTNRQKAPAIIIWSVTGYYPEATPTWLPPHMKLEVSADDLADILELDDECTDLIHSSLWEAATGGQINLYYTPLSPDEIKIIVAIKDYLKKIETSECLPEYLKYYLITFASTLKILIAANPTEWSEIKRFATVWSLSIDEKWSSLRPSALQALASLHNVEKDVVRLINNVMETVNSRASGLVEFLTQTVSEKDSWYFVCDRPEQVKAAASTFRALGILPRVQPILLRELSVCKNCIVAGWVSSSFTRKLQAHTPRVVIAVIDEAERYRWERIGDARQTGMTHTLLGAVSSDQKKGVSAGLAPATQLVWDDKSNPKIDARWDNNERIPCVLLWVIGEPNVKVLEPHDRVIVEEEEIVCERVATRLRPDERVILSLGTSRWSPSEEFTGAIMDAVRTSNPDLVKAAKEWRQSLFKVINERHLSIPQLRTLLASLGIERESQTIEGWLDIERASPIAPRGMKTELSLLWPLIEKYVVCSFDEISAACGRLRSLRAASERALLQHWKGRSVGLEIEETWLDEIVDRLRQEVHVYEVEAIVLGQLPPEMIGWWIPRSMAESVETYTGNISPRTEGSAEDDVSPPE